MKANNWKEEDIAPALDFFKNTKGDTWNVSYAVESKYKNLSSTLKSNIAFITEIVTLHGRLLRFINDDFKKDSDIIRAAINTCDHVFEIIFYPAYLNVSDKTNINTLLTNQMIIDVLKNNGLQLRYIHPSMQSKKMVLAAVTSSGMALQFAANEFKGDTRIILTAVKNNGFSLNYVQRYHLKNNIEYNLSQNNLRKVNKKIVFEAVKNYGDALMFLSGHNINIDDNIRLRAVKSTGGALKYIPDYFQNSEIVMAAIIQNGGALLYAKNEFKNDFNYQLLALQRCRSITYVDQGLQDNLHLILSKSVPFRTLCGMIKIQRNAPVIVTLQDAIFSKITESHMGLQEWGAELNWTPICLQINDTTVDWISGTTAHNINEGMTLNDIAELVYDSNKEKCSTSYIIFSYNGKTMSGEHHVYDIKFMNHTIQQIKEMNL